MSAHRHINGPMAGPARLLLAGALLAAALGTGAGAALRPDMADRGGERAAPQQMILSEPDLAGAEQAGRGWPDPIWVPKRAG